MKRKVVPEKDSGMNAKKKSGRSRRAKQRCPASDAVLEIKRLGNEKIGIVLAEGWENVLPQKGEDDPGSLIMWDDDNITATVHAFNAAIAAGAAAPAWMNLGAGNPITVPGLKASILAHVQANAGGGGVVGNCLIAPNDMKQYGKVVTQLNNVGFYPLFAAHAVCPIGRNYILADRRSKTTAVADPVMAPPAGMGVQVFA